MLYRVFCATNLLKIDWLIATLQAKFSEEDQVLRERVDRLNEEIHFLHAPVQKLREMRSHQVGGRHRVCTITPSWSSAHFSASVSESGAPNYTSTPRRSVPVLLVSSSSRDNLQEDSDLSDPVHETIAEQEEGASGFDRGGAVRCNRNGYSGHRETRPINYN